VDAGIVAAACSRSQVVPGARRLRRRKEERAFDVRRGGERKGATDTLGGETKVRDRVEKGEVGVG